MGNSAPLISVVIPTCHRNDLLAKCLDCLAPGVQTLDADQYEVIVTDDGSTSTAEEMVKASYPWAKWTQGPRRGPAANRNHGATLTQGEWIAFTDDDCMPDPNWLTEFHGALVQDKKVYEGRTTCRDSLPSPLYSAPINETGGYLWSCNIMIAKSLFHELNGFDESYPYPAMEDVDLRERIKDAGHSFPFVQTAVVDHPPRPVPGPQYLAMTHECEFIYAFRRGELLSKFSMLCLVAKVRLREIVRRPKSWDSSLAFGRCIAELVITARQFSKWKKQLTPKDIKKIG